MSYQNIREEELKNRIAKDYFWLYDCAKIIGNVDFCVTMHHEDKEIIEENSLMWAEAKKGIADIYKALVQLILTIGKARTFDKSLPPNLLGAFDAEKIAFIPYNEVAEVFYQNDFNWNVTPSNHETKEFKLIFDLVKTILDDKSLIFYYGKDEKELKKFIKENFIVGKLGISKIKVDKNNFMVIYNKWLDVVKPTIAVNWEIAKKNDIIDGDFYLADLLSDNNKSLKDSLYVLLKTDHYESARKINDMGMFDASSSHFSDKQVAHTKFWNRYERPPKQIYWDHITGRRDLLVPQGVRERKGSFFTPQIWVKLSQKYLTDFLGEGWQDEYYIWDCACGTGNLLAGLDNKYNIYASTLDRQDIDVIKDQIKNGANLLEDHTFQFDFLNDDFTKLPLSLQNIINDPEKRKKLVIYINPPYAEAGTGVGKGFKNEVAITNKSYLKYKNELGNASNELFAQFLARIYFEIPNCIIGEFSKLKLLNGSNSIGFRSNFLAKLEKCFIVPADTFDNVKGSFPIGFKIWDTSKKEKFEMIDVAVFDATNTYLNTKKIYSYDNEKGRINDWLQLHKNDTNNYIGTLMADSPDFQHTNLIAMQNKKGTRHGIYFNVNYYNLLVACTYLAVRQVIEATWLNDRDQFVFPNTGWETDNEFQNDCLAFSLFDSQNKITSNENTNHWIPFTEKELNAREKFDSNFMSKFIAGKLKMKLNGSLFDINEVNQTPLTFSAEAKAVFDAGRELWKYYHKQPNCNVNASLYDIREHFQGRSATGKMNNKSTDEKYTLLISDLRNKLKELAQKIAPKVYEYGFLKS